MQSEYFLSCLALALPDPPAEPPPEDPDDPEEPDPPPAPPRPSPPSWLSSWSNGLAPCGSAMSWLWLRSSSEKSRLSVPDWAPLLAVAGALTPALTTMRRSVESSLPV